MKRVLSLALVVATAFAVLSLGPAPAARAAGGGGCSLATVAGLWSLSYNGVAIVNSSQVPVAAVGNFHTDAAGNFTGSEINNLAGSAAYQTLTGNITVRPDCSGSLAAKVYQGGSLVRTSYIHLQYDSDSHGFSAIFEKLVLPDNSTLPVVITISGRRVF